MTTASPRYYEITHYYRTPKEMDSLSGKGPGPHDHDAALCGNGSFHFKRTRNKEGVFILDGRNTAETMRNDARKQAQRLEHWRKYPAFQIVSGTRLFEERRRGPVHRLTYPIQVKG